MSQRSYIRLSKLLDPEEVITWTKIVGYAEDSEYESNGKTFKVKADSTRYKVFDRDKYKCQACGIVGTRMYLEQQTHQAKDIAHFNLYAIEDGKPLIFTKDHVLPRSMGGLDAVPNLQTYCYTCNEIKADDFLTNSQVAQLREIRRKKGIIDRRELAKLAGINLLPKYVPHRNEPDHTDSKSSSVFGALVLNSDLIARPFFDDRRGGYEAFKHDAVSAKTFNNCTVIPKGTMLKVIKLTKSTLICKVNGSGKTLHISNNVFI